jgi:hypothetical protein
MFKQRIYNDLAGTPPFVTEIFVLFLNPIDEFLGSALTL